MNSLSFNEKAHARRATPMGGGARIVGAAKSAFEDPRSPQTERKTRGDLAHGARYLETRRRDRSRMGRFTLRATGNKLLRAPDVSAGLFALILHESWCLGLSRHGRGHRFGSLSCPPLPSRDLDNTRYGRQTLVHDLNA